MLTINIAQSKEYETIPFNHFSSGGGPNTITNLGLLENLYGLMTRLYGNWCFAVFLFDTMT